jgi:hypothetical protein
VILAATDDLASRPEGRVEVHPSRSWNTVAKLGRIINQKRDARFRPANRLDDSKARRELLVDDCCRVELADENSR